MLSQSEEVHLFPRVHTACPRGHLLRCTTNLRAAQADRASRHEREMYRIHPTLLDGHPKASVITAVLIMSCFAYGMATLLQPAVRYGSAIMLDTLLWVYQKPAARPGPADT